MVGFEGEKENNSALSRELSLGPFASKTAQHATALHLHDSRRRD